MEAWMVGMVANAAISLAYFGIFGAILMPLVKGGQVRKNPLGTATAAIFLTCAVHHGVHAVHMLMPAFDVDLVQGLAMRQAWGWQLATWDVIGALVGAYYWSLRRTYGSLMQGAQLFDDMRKREEQALEINDSILQAIVVAKLSLDLGQQSRAEAALDKAIQAASHLITDLLGGEVPDETRMTRRAAAVIEAEEAGAASSTPTRERE
jgi:hypothetical protein